MNAADAIGWVLVGGLVLLSLFAISVSHSRLDDPNDHRTVYLRELPAVAELAGQGAWLVRIIRQSGYTHAEYDVTGSAADALNVAMQTFRRAKIDTVHIGKNTETVLVFGRMYHDHRGSNEGKKVGRAEIAKVA